MACHSVQRHAGIGRVGARQRLLQLAVGFLAFAVAVCSERDEKDGGERGHRGGCPAVPCATGEGTTGAMHGVWRARTT